MQSTSTTIFNNLNSLSSATILNVNNLNISEIFIFDNQITSLSSLNVYGISTFVNIFATDLPKKSIFVFTVSTPCIIGTTHYHRDDIDSRLYTKSINPGPFTQTRTFQFISWLAIGSHNSGLDSLTYCVDYSLVNYTGLCSLSTYNGVNAMPYGYPYNNYNLNKVTPK